jgi:serine/threonine protein kinase
MYRKILQDPLRFPDDMGSEARSVLTLLLNRDPSRRLGVNGAQDIKNHPFFARHIDWKKLMAKKIQPPFKPAVVRRFEPASARDREADVVKPTRQAPSTHQTSTKSLLRRSRRIPSWRTPTYLRPFSSNCKCPLNFAVGLTGSSSRITARASRGVKARWVNRTNKNTKQSCRAFEFLCAVYPSLAIRWRPKVLQYM